MATYFRPANRALAEEDTRAAIGHRVFLIASAFLVCLYAFSVVAYSRAIPDIGMHTAFTLAVNRIDRAQIRQLSGPRPVQKQDEITRVGDVAVYTWPALLHELAEVARGDGEEVVIHLRPPLGMDDGNPASAMVVACRIDREPIESLVPSVLWFFLKGGLFLVALLVYWKRPGDRSATQFFLLSIVAVCAWMGGYHWWRIVPSPPLLLVFMVSSVLLPAVTLHFYVVFPRPKAFLQRYPRTSWLIIYGVPSLFLLALLLGYFRARILFHSQHDPEDVKRALEDLLLRIFVYLGVAGLWYIGCVVCLIHSYRTARDTTERNQVKWILFGSLAALAPIGYSLYLAAFAPDDFGSGAATWPMFAASACFTAAFAISITRYRLMQLDQVIGSGMVYFLTSCVAGLVYYAVVFLGMLLVGTQVMPGPSLGIALAISTTALVLTVVRDVARDRFKKALDRRYRREKVHLDQTLQRMGQTLEQMVDPAGLAQRLLQASAELLGVAQGAVYLREGQPPLYRLADLLGPPPPLTELASGCPLVDALQIRPVLTARSAPWGISDPAQGQLRFLGGEVAQALTHEGQVLALLVLGPKDSGPYRPDDLALLAAFAQITALALQNAERHRTIDDLNRDLHAKVEKIGEQQRRILTLQSQLQIGAREQHAVSRGPAKEPAATDTEPWPADGIVGTSVAIRQVLQLVRKVALSPSAVLLLGESGTGKELLARALHEQSPRAGKAFVKVHCAALSPGLLESELFGHVKGAFTGAHRDKVGRFEMAHGGTLFLDEIGDVSLEVQTKLLRVLQEKTIERVGSGDPMPVDVRVLAATNQNLEALIRQGRFREDLFYRINGITIAVPPLRERREDVPELALHFLRHYAQRCGKGVTRIDDDAMVALKSQPWPGNIRQLENVIERAVVIADGDCITLEELPPEMTAIDETADEFPAPHGKETIPSRKNTRAERDQRERERLVRALAAAAGNKSEAARALGLARSTLLSRLQKHGLS